MPATSSPRRSRAEAVTPQHLRVLVRESRQLRQLRREQGEDTDQHQADQGAGECDGRRAVDAVGQVQREVRDGDGADQRDQHRGLVADQRRHDERHQDQAARGQSDERPDALPPPTKTTAATKSAEQPPHRRRALEVGVRVAVRRWTGLDVEQHHPVAGVHLRHPEVGVADQEDAVVTGVGPEVISTSTSRHPVRASASTASHVVRFADPHGRVRRSCRAGSRGPVPRRVATARRIRPSWAPRSHDQTTSHASPPSSGGPGRGSAGLGVSPAAFSCPRAPSADRPTAGRTRYPRGPDCSSSTRLPSGSARNTSSIADAGAGRLETVPPAATTRRDRRSRSSTWNARCVSPSCDPDADGVPAVRGAVVQQLDGERPCG